MIRKFPGVSLLLAWLCSGLLLWGCAAVPSEPEASIPPGLTMEQIRRAIIRAGVDNNWQMQEVDDRTFRGLHDRHAQHAIILISYDSLHYAIRYAGNAEQLSASPLSITTYNSWVEELGHTIDAYLTREP